MNHLNPDLLRDQWTPAEDQLLMGLHREFGNNYSKNDAARKQYNQESTALDTVQEDRPTELPNAAARARGGRNRPSPSVDTDGPERVAIQSPITISENVQPVGCGTNPWGSFSRPGRSSRCPKTEQNWGI
jgi:hypothetical protein